MESLSVVVVGEDDGGKELPRVTVVLVRVAGFESVHSDVC